MKYKAILLNVILILFINAVTAQIKFCTITVYDIYYIPSLAPAAKNTPKLIISYSDSIKSQTIDLKPCNIGTTINTEALISNNEQITKALKLAGEKGYKLVTNSNMMMGLNNLNKEADQIFITRYILQKE